MRLSILFFLFCSMFVSAQTDTLTLNNSKFLKVIKTELSEYNKKDTVLILYRLEKNTKKYLLKHYLYRWSADCNNVFKDIGTMQVENDSIIFETKYKQKLSDPIPTKSKQIYKVDTFGKLKLIYNKQVIGGKWVSAN